MKKSELQILLSKLASLEKTNARLEQYQTPPDIAAELIWQASVAGDLDGAVADLGCGNGVLAIGAAIMGAEVTGYDIDERAITTAEENADRIQDMVDHELRVAFKRSDVRGVTEQVDTVLMNPPFGLQRGTRDANRVFLEQAFSIADAVYAILHQSEKNRDGTRRYIAGLARGAGFSSEILGWLHFPLPNTKSFHEKNKMHIKVDLYSFRTDRS